MNASWYDAPVAGPSRVMFSQLKVSRLSLSTPRATADLCTTTLRAESHVPVGAGNRKLLDEESGSPLLGFTTSHTPGRVQRWRCSASFVFFLPHVVYCQSLFSQFGPERSHNNSFACFELLTAHALCLFSRLPDVSSQPSGPLVTADISFIPLHQSRL